MRRVVPVAALCVLAGCGSPAAPPTAPTQESAGPSAAEQQAARLAAQQDCMITAWNNTLAKQQSDSEMDAAFARQSLGTCPSDFAERFVALANAVHLFRSAAAAKIAHQSGESEAVAASGISTLAAFFNGQPTGYTPYTDWRSEGSETDQRLRQLYRQIEDDTAALRQVAARYRLFEQAPPAPPVSEGALH